MTRICRGTIVKFKYCQTARLKILTPGDKILLLKPRSLSMVVSNVGKNHLKIVGSEVND